MTTTTEVAILDGVADGQAVWAAGDADAITTGNGLGVCEPARPRRIGDRGMISAEWAVGLIAAIAIAGVLVGIVTSGPVRDALLEVILNVIGWIATTLGALPH